MNSYSRLFAQPQSPLYDLSLICSYPFIYSHIFFLGWSAQKPGQSEHLAEDRAQNYTYP